MFLCTLFVDLTLDLENELEKLHERVHVYDFNLTGKFLFEKLC